MRLIDADALLKEDFTERFIDVYDNAVFEAIIEDAPTVDIKPEVAREIFEEIEKLISAKTHNYLLCGSRSQKSIEYGRQYTLRELNVEFAELKNKYIGGVGE